MRASTSRNITLYSAIASAILLAAGMSGAWYVHVLQGRVAWALADNVTSIRAAIRMQAAVAELRHAVERYNLSGDSADFTYPENYVSELTSAAADVTHFASTEYEFGLMREMNAGLSQYLAQIPTTNSPQEPTGGRRAISDTLLATKVLPNLKRYLDFNEAELSDRSRDNQAMASWLVLALGLLGVGGAAAGVASGYWLARGIRRTVYQLSIPVRDVAGRLNQIVGPVEINENPAIDDLEAALNTIADEVRSIIEKFEASHRQVIRSEQLAALGQLAAGLAHELHNPLMSIKILVQSARSDGETLDGEDLRVLDEEIARLQELLQSFLNFARPAKLERRQIDLRTIVAQTVTILTARAARRRVTIKSFGPKIPVILSADETQLRQVVLNLLLNALDAVRDNGTIWVDIGQGKQAAYDELGMPTPMSAVFLSIADNGRGLPSEGAARIFEPFFSTKETGLGLGLAVCQRIVESHGGTIQAAARPGSGAVFMVSLPTAMQFQMPTATTAAEHAESLATNKDHRPEPVLATAKGTV